MTKAEIAQKWAEANEAMQATQLTLDAAHTAHNDAVRVESEAWGELQRVSGHPIPNPPGAVGSEDVEEAEIIYSTEPVAPPAYRHSLAVKPIG